MKKALLKILEIFLLILIGIAFALVLINYENTRPDSRGIPLFWFFIMPYGALYAQVIIHEAGHLVFGLMTGYRFCSFRIGSLVLIRVDGKLKLRRLRVKGTAGQCLLSPPEMKDGRVPYVFYNLGGCYLNIISAALFAGIALLNINNVLTLIMYSLALIGLLLAVTNGIPKRLKLMNNDGHNTLAISKSKAALRAFWIQIKVHELISRGVRVKDMPAEWFAMPETFENSMVAVLGSLACNRLIDEMRFDEAEKNIEHLLATETSLVGRHKSLLQLELAFCRIIGNKEADMKELKHLKGHPSMLRIQYAHALLVENDPRKANAILRQFNKAAEVYPYPSEMVAERELIAYVESLLSQRS